MTCIKCSCKVFKPEAGYNSCLCCGQHHWINETPVRPSIKPAKQFGNLTQLQRSTDIYEEVVKHFPLITEMRGNSIPWPKIKETLVIDGCTETISKHWRTLREQGL